MVIKKDNGKVKLELTNDELIIKKIFKDKRIKLKDIRSACLTENQLVILNYDYKITCVAISNINWSFKEQLKLLVDEINKEDVIFKNPDRLWSEPLFFICIVLPRWSMVFENNTLPNIISSIILTFLVGFIIWNSKRFSGVIYNINTKTFTRVGYRNFNKETFKLEDVEFIKRKEEGLKYKIKKSGYKFYLEYRATKIVYPMRHGKISREIENYFLKTEIFD